MSTIRHRIVGIGAEQWYCIAVTEGSVEAMAVPQHIVRFAEKSMEQAALLTFAKNLNMVDTKFLSASREHGKQCS